MPLSSQRKAKWLCLHPLRIEVRIRLSWSSVWKILVTPLGTSPQCGIKHSCYFHQSFWYNHFLLRGFVGLGIPPEKQSLLFKAFSQVDSSTHRQVDHRYSLSHHDCYNVRDPKYTSGSTQAFEVFSRFLQKLTAITCCHNFCSQNLMWYHLSIYLSI